MDVRNWPLDRIMQLPDACFGRRWPIIFSDFLAAGGTTYYISEMALPDICVLWELSVFLTPLTAAVTPPNMTVGLALGDQLPTTDAQMAEMESLIPSADEIDTGVRVMRGPLSLTRLKKPVMAQGRRVVVRVMIGSVVPGIFCVGLVFSSLPKEVPDCLLSA